MVYKNMIEYIDNVIEKLKIHSSGDFAEAQTIGEVVALLVIFRNSIENNQHFPYPHPPSIRNMLLHRYGSELEAERNADGQG